MISNAHDRFFKAVFGKPSNAAALIRTALPGAFVRHVELSALAPARGSSVDDRLAERLADLLFRVPV